MTKAKKYTPMGRPAFADPEPEETIEQILSDMQGYIDDDEIQAKVKAEALDRLNTYFNSLAEEIIGPDEGVELWRVSLKPKNNLHNRFRRSRDKLRAEQRQRKDRLLKQGGSDGAF